jgi:hypothetical protein
MTSIMEQIRQKRNLERRQLALDLHFAQEEADCFASTITGGQPCVRSFSGSLWVFAAQGWWG